MTLSGPAGGVMAEALAGTAAMDEANGRCDGVAAAAEAAAPAGLAADDDADGGTATE